MQCKAALSEQRRRLPATILLARLGPRRRRASIFAVSWATRKGRREPKRLRLFGRDKKAKHAKQGELKQQTGGGSERPPQTTRRRRGAASPGARSLLTSFIAQLSRLSAAAAATFVAHLHLFSTCCALERHLCAPCAQQAAHTRRAHEDEVQPEAGRSFRRCRRLSCDEN